MKPILETLKQSWKKLLMYVIAIVICIVLYYIFRVILLTAPEFSGIPYAVAKAMIGILTLKLIDELMLYEVDTMQILKNNATAYSLYLLAYAIIIAVSIAGA